MFEIENEVKFIQSETKRLQEKYPKITIAPFIYKVEENRLSISFQDFRSSFARINRKQYCDQPADDMGVAVAKEIKSLLMAVFRRPVPGRQPHLANAPLYLGARDARIVGQLFQRLAKLNHVAVTVFPLIQKFEVGANFVDSHCITFSIGTDLMSIRSDRKCKSVGEQR